MHFGRQADRGRSQDKRPHCKHDRDDRISLDFEQSSNKNEIEAPINTANYRVAKKKVATTRDTLFKERKALFDALTHKLA